MTIQRTSRFRNTFVPSSINLCNRKLKKSYKPNHKGRTRIVYGIHRENVGYDINFVLHCDNFVYVIVLGSLV